MKYLFVEADTNDADYVQSMEKITEKQLVAFSPLLKAIKDFKSKKPYEHSWPDGEYCNGSTQELYPDIDTELIEEFKEFVPRGEHGVHSIESIKVYEVSSVNELV